MSFGSEYMKLRNKRINEGGNTKQEGSKSSFTEEYTKLRKKRIVEEEKNKSAILLQNSKLGWENWLKVKGERDKEKSKTSAFEDNVIRTFSTSSDSPFGVILNNVVYDKQQDTHYQEPQDDWTEQEKLTFGAYYYNKDYNAAFKYAANLNNQKALVKKNEKKEKIAASATSSGLAGLRDTAGAILAGTTGLADYLDDLTDFAAGRSVIVEEDNVTPFEYSQTAKEAISGKLNEMSGTLDERVPVIGGKGVGDVYGLGVGALSSWLSALTLGPTGTAISYFGQGAASAVDSAVERGATEEQAIAYATIVGLGEGVSNYLPTENLLKVGSAKAVEGWFASVAKQAGLESLEGAFSSTVEKVADAWVMRDKSEFNKKIAQYQLSGMSKDEAVSKAFLDTVNDVAYDTLAEGISGGISASLQVAGRNIVHSSKLSSSEQAVVDKEVERRVSEQEKDGKKLSKREIGKIEEQVQSDLEKGYISTDTIEEVLGGETYKAYKDAADNEKALKEEYNELRRMKKGEMNDIQQDRLAELKAMSLEDGSKSSQLKAKLDSEISKLVKDSRLAESYNEQARQSQRFEADLNQYSEKQRKIVQKAIDGGILNNTNRAHELVDLVAKVGADKGIDFDFADNAKLKESGFALEGVTVNGFLNDGSVTVNVNSAKALNSVVGHEIAHVLEGTELYSALQSELKSYLGDAEYSKRLAAIKETYKNVYKGEDADVRFEQELTADLVGDLLFIDSDFVYKLSTQNRNIFQKLFDEIKYLCKVATAGTKEARQLEKIKKTFEDAYRESNKAQKNTATEDGVRYAISSDVVYEKYCERISGIENSDDITQKGQYIEVSQQTPSIIVEKAKAKNLPMAILFDVAYLETRHDGKLEGNYHNLGAKNMKTLPKLLETPEYIVELANGRLNIIVDLSTTKGKQALVSIELEQPKQVNGKFNKYNLILTAFGAKSGYLNKIIDNPDNKVLYNKKAESQGTDQLHKGLDGINDSASNNKIPQKEPVVNTNSMQENRKNSLSAENEDIAPVKNGIYGKDVALQQKPLGPVREDISKAETISKTENVQKALGPVREDIKPTTKKVTGKAIAPTKENVDRKARISMEEFANSEASVWNNVEYDNDAAKNKIMQETHDSMVAEGSVVMVSDGTLENVSESFPDLRSMKKKERTQLLKESINKLKNNLRQFLSGFKEQSFEFEVNGKVLDAKLYSTGINEVLEKVTQEKANMLYTTEEIFKNSRYLYSTPDYDGDPNVYRWNYFYTPVQIGDETVGVRIAVRDLAKQGESQIYHWGIKKDASLDGVRDDSENRKSHDVSSDASNSIISKTEPVVNHSNDNLAPVADKWKKKEQAQKASEQEKVAEVLDTEPEVPKKSNRLWSKLVTNFVDKGAVFEKLSLKTNNRELMGKWNYMLSSDARAQRLIGNGADGVKSLNAIREEVEKTGKTKEFYSYMYHQHNIDRMSREARAGEAINEIIKSLNGYNDSQIEALSKRKITDKTSEADAELISKAQELIRLSKVKNKAVFGDVVTAQVSQGVVQELETKNPEFKKFSKDVYDYMNHLRKMMVNKGLISQETADLWSKIYPHYVPVRRVGDTGLNINVPLDTGRTGVNAPIKAATGGNSNILPLFDTMAQRTLQTFKAIDKNRFGVELKNTLGSSISNEAAGVDDAIDSVDTHEELLQEGKNGRNPTFTVFENGERVTFEITEDMYDALRPTSSTMAATFKPANFVNNLRRGMLTEYNPTFMATNAIKDVQDVLVNSQHPAATYKNIPKAVAELAKKGKWYTEYMENGGEQNTYFDKQSNAFEKEKGALRKALGFPLDKISEANNFIERVPRLAEYIASREAGASVEVAMLDAARVTTNFAAGGDVTKFLNRNGATFLNASVQGFNQQVRNIREAKANGLKGWAQLAIKYAIAGLPAILLNSLLWDDDEDYEELSDYVKDNYYIVGKFGDGNFVRIPKGRTLAVIQDGLEQIGNTLTGDPKTDWGNFLDLFMSNLAPNDPLDNNIVSPIVQVAKNETWYGEDLVPSRLQDLPASEQFDESTDAISKWLGEKTNFSPVKINYLLDQYSGGLGDVVLPMLTPEAEGGDNSFLGNILAPMKDKFTTDSVMNNQNVSDFYDTMDELTTNAKRSAATDEDILKNKYFNSVNTDLSELYKLKREIQNSSLADDEKYSKVRELQREIDDIAKNALSSYHNVSVYNGYATVADQHYKINNDGEWQKLSDSQVEKLEIFGKAVGGNAAYINYTSELNSIKSDKDQNGDTISGSRKKKVLKYINSLDADYGEKIILYKSQYTGDDTYNYDIVDYLNSRSDISYTEMKTILEELGFTVLSDGTVQW